MPSIQIRRIDVSELEKLQSIARSTFAETFSSVNTPENMESYLREAFSRERLTAELTSSGSRFYLAELDGRVIGYLKLNSGESQTELREERGVEIERIYVLGSYHGREVGKLLHEKALSVARELNAEYLWLGVSENNPRAVRFYTKNGYVPFGSHAFQLGSEEQTDIMMRRELVPDR